MSKERDDAADEWFYDLGSMAKRIEQNEDRHARTRRRQYAVVAFVLFAFMLLAYRTEVQASRIDSNTKKISNQQESNCEGSITILTNFNLFLDQQIKIEKSNPFVDEPLRKARIAAYEGARISPLPVCFNK